MRKWLVAGVFIAAVGAMLAPAAVVVAATSTPAPSGPNLAASPGQGLEISPPVLELKADPGQTISATIRVRNVAGGELIAKGRVDDFGPGSDEGGQPRLLLDETGANRYSLKYWVQSVPDLRLAPQELKTATVNIRVPANAEPGGHFGVIRFTAVPPELEGTGVALSASVGTLVLLRISGTVKDKVSLIEFASMQGDRKTSFFEYGPVGFMVRLKNEGTVHEKVQGSIEITNMFGKKVGSAAVNPRGGNVLPDSIRRFPSRDDKSDKLQLDNKRLFGKYTARLNLSYLGGQEKLSATTTFWVIPWRLIILVIVGLIALMWVLRMGIKRYNEHIIAQARKH